MSPSSAISLFNRNSSFQFAELYFQEFFYSIFLSVSWMLEGKRTAVRRGDVLEVGIVDKILNKSVTGELFELFKIL
jgi:hypothetical protein